MPADVFLDTNLFVYQIEALDEAISPIADRIIGEGIASGGACMGVISNHPPSRQNSVLRERFQS